MTIQEFPRPPIALVVLSIAIILGACVGIGAAIAEMVMWPDACSSASAIMLILFCVAVLIGHWQACLRREQTAAQLLAVIYLGLTAIIIVCLGSFLWNTATVNGGNSSLVYQLGFWKVLSLLVSSAGLLAVAALLSYRWSNRLKEFYCDSTFGKPWRPWGKWDSYALFPLAVVIETATIVFAGWKLPPCAEHVAADRAPSFLPDSATDISYCRGFRGTFAAEFTIDEPGFVSWVKAAVETPGTRAEGITLEEVRIGQRVTRYYDLTGELDGPEEFRLGPGLSFSWSYEDQGIHAAYDRNTHRAYYFVHYH